MADQAEPRRISPHRAVAFVLVDQVGHIRNVSIEMGTKADQDGSPHGRDIQQASY